MPPREKEMVSGRPDPDTRFADSYCGWYDYWSKKWFDGGQWINYHAPLDILPLFMREGSIIPMTSEDPSHTGEISDDRFCFELYGVHGDDGQENVKVFP